MVCTGSSSVLGRFMLTYWGVMCNDCNPLWDILPEEKRQCIYRKEGEVGSSLWV